MTCADCDRLDDAHHQLRLRHSEKDGAHRIAIATGNLEHARALQAELDDLRLQMDAVRSERIHHNEVAHPSD